MEESTGIRHQTDLTPFEREWYRARIELRRSQPNELALLTGQLRLAVDPT